ncbi:hypothetical protein ELQ35_05990 [Peribacillus cavernae]|uniref:Uncharacterized protein n=1 Tax=Peribacillus cavernae TaxID=1674310 RepID=A0A3S0VFG5_9BACI|nr:hypothetical protein [Peribacillus cavernae]MDQ0220668.1 hypothetical protein [Peribacillus cavernae]RUQ31122.1 hypothetical protein ELQ35_05990 [Peribacillus cavernae]
MGGSLHKRELALENLEAASEKLDPYIKSIREAAPKASDNADHFQKDLRRKKWKKGYAEAKEWFSWRAIIYVIPAGIIGWCFKLDTVFGFFTMITVLLFLFGLLINYTMGIKTLHDMTDESKKDYFHYYAYTNHRREYEIFSLYLLKGNGFKFKQAVELFKEWDKDIETKDDMILKLKKDLERAANDSANLPIYAQQEVDFANALSAKLLDKIERKDAGNLSFRSMEFFGHYAIYRLEEDRLVREHCSRPNPNVPEIVDFDDRKLKNMSYIKILNSSFAWEADKKSTISLVVEVADTVYVYTVIVENRNQYE